MQSLGMMLHDAARLLKREFERQARDHRLSLTQWRVLAQLAGCDGLTQTAIGTLVEASPMTVSDILERLEEMELVRRETDPSDSRAKLVWMTEAGDALVGEMREIAAGVYDRALQGISENDVAALTRALGQINSNLGQEPQNNENEQDAPK